MKLLIQIPCFNEAETLPSVLETIPKSIQGIDIIETVVIDDGSSDDTVKVAKSLGVNHIISNIGNKGLAYSFRTGLDYAISQNADILINTDGDNQYPSHYISELVVPILKSQADIVVGDRQTHTIKHFSLIKRFFQWLGTRITRFLSSDAQVKDAVSGFRAYSRAALLELNVTSDFSYILDTTVQSSHKKIKTISIPITVNLPTRPSRLFKNMWQHIWKSGKLILRIYAMYKPIRFFFSIGTIMLIIGIYPIGRFLLEYFSGNGEGHIQSLIIGSVLISISFNLFALGIVGDLMGKNRTLIEYIIKELKSKK